MKISGGDHFSKQSSIFSKYGAPPFSIGYQANLPCSIIFHFVATFIRQKYHMPTPENTSKNRKQLDEVRDVMDGNEYLNIEVGLFACLWHLYLVFPVLTAGTKEKWSGMILVNLIISRKVNTGQ